MGYLKAQKGALRVFLESPAIDAGTTIMAPLLLSIPVASSMPVFFLESSVRHGLLSRLPPQPSCPSPSCPTYATTRGLLTAPREILGPSGFCARTSRLRVQPQ